MALTLLVVFSGLFVASHIVLSTLAIKGALVRAIGEKGFMGVYALVALATLGGMIVMYAGFDARGSALWAPLGWSDPAVYVLMLLSILFLALSQANPSPVGADMGMKAKPEARGILRVTAHPQNWGMVCFGLAHVLVTGTVGGLALYGSLVVVGIVGAYHETAKKAKDQDETVQTFLKETGVIPFSAIIRGRNRLALREFGIAAVIGALVVFGVSIGVHFIL